MEPITTALAINAVVLYLAKKLADNKGISNSQITDNSINQHHTGSGNNVAGNKIGTQTADKIYNIDRIDNAKF